MPGNIARYFSAAFGAADLRIVPPSRRRRVQVEAACADASGAN